MPQPNNHLDAAKAILSRPAADIGDYEVAEATAHAVAAAAEQLAEIVRILNNGAYVIQVDSR